MSASGCATATSVAITTSRSSRRLVVVIVLTSRCPRPCLHRARSSNGGWRSAKLRTFGAKRAYQDRGFGSFGAKRAKSGFESCQLLLRPLRVQLEAARLAPVDDPLPRVHRFLAAAQAFEEERAHVQRADVVGIQLQRTAPVAQCALRVARFAAHLRAGADENRVVRRDGQASLDHFGGLAVVMGGQVSACEKPIFANVVRSGGQSLFVQRDGGLRLS